MQLSLPHKLTAKLAQATAMTSSSESPRNPVTPLLPDVELGGTGCVLLLPLFKVQFIDCRSSKLNDHNVMFTTLAAKATQSRAPVDVTLIVHELCRSGNSSLQSELASKSPKKKVV